MITPLNGNLIVKLEKLKEVTTSSGLIISQDEVLVEKAAVVAASETSDLKPGNTVYYKSYSLSTVKIGDEEYNFLPESELLGYE